MPALMTAAALMNASMAVASGVATIVTADRLGTAWGGAAATAGIVGTGFGALVSTRLRMGRGRALQLGYAVGTLGAAALLFAAVNGDVLGLLAGMVLLGVGNAAAQLSRYAAASLYGDDRRGRAIGSLVWAAALGAVGGPLLLGPAGDLADGLGRAPAAGPLLLALVAVGLAAVAARWAPAGSSGALAPSPVPVRRLLVAPAARAALAVMATAQLVMVAVMTAAPVEMHDHGHGLASIGAVLSAHTLGMFALSPLTGRLADAAGPRRVAVAGLAVLLLSTVLGAVGPAAPAYRAGVLFLLGYAWNLCFVGGSALLAGAVTAAERPRLEGAVDAAVWGLAAGAGLLSTVILAAGGYAVLTLAAGLLVPVAAVVLARSRAGNSLARSGVTTAA